MQYELDWAPLFEDVDTYWTSLVQFSGIIKWKRYNCRNLLKPIQFIVLYNSRYAIQPFFSILQTFIEYKIKKACLQFRRHSNNVTSLVGRNNEILITIMVLLFLFINFNINFVHMQVTNQWNNHLPWSYNWNNNWKKKKRIE